MTPNFSALEADVIQAQTWLNERTRLKQAASAATAAANAQRPAGLPPSWLPDFKLSGTNVVVVAWFDSVHFGNQLNRS